eukprot:CAMPEP_0173379860 /NCGR_PEP_ID=MMETSP1356-20130122/2674_1 /TAXON_ID=77927 ORGANISM="Hemiselmis virescens, Strain PCC157" /NCGR_SAMPLE_ID=MMETSP1356 /ASSEMBLY_ACC=CAM_ASM_000847 /LENGTH=184 /DNA_ID=CAMNT_0014333287 /DNA_START=24 /DNA_END=578 /DNA_ORIENTATION=+
MAHNSVMSMLKRLVGRRRSKGCSAQDWERASRQDPSLHNRRGTSESKCANNEGETDEDAHWEEAGRNAVYNAYLCAPIGAACTDPDADVWDSRGSSGDNDDGGKAENGVLRSVSFSSSLDDMSFELGQSPPAATASDHAGARGWVGRGGDAGEQGNSSDTSSLRSALRRKDSPDAHDARGYQLV